MAAIQFERGFGCLMPFLDKVNGSSQLSKQPAARPECLLTFPMEKTR